VSATLAGVAVGVEGAAAFRGGFGGFGGFHGFGGDRFGGFGGFRGFSGFHSESFGGSRFGDGGFFDRSTDAGFGRGGWGSIHNASSFSDRAGTWDQDHPEWHQNAEQLQQNRFTEANQLQQNRFNDARYLQYNRVNTWNHYTGDWGGYYSGLGFGAGFAIGATMAVLPAAAIALTVAGNPFYYANGVYYAPQGGQYTVVAPPQGAIVTTPPQSCSNINLPGGGSGLDCGGAFYAKVGNGWQVISPPVGSTVWTLPNGAVNQNVNGVSYFAFGGAYYRPIYSGSSVYYEVVANPG
jgi:hypothetical protein